MRSVPEFQELDTVFLLFGTLLISIASAFKVSNALLLVPPGADAEICT